MVGHRRCHSLDVNLKFHGATLRQAFDSSNAITKFSDSANDQIPALVLFTGEVTPEKIALVESFAQTLGSKILVHSDGELLKDANGKEISIPISDYFIKGAPITTFPSEDGKAILANFPISVQIATELLPDGKEPALPGVVDAIRFYASDFAKSNSFVLTQRSCLRLAS